MVTTSTLAEGTTSPPSWIDLINESVPTIHDIDVSDIEAVNRDSIGKQPYRIHIDTDHDRCDVVIPVANRIRAEFLCRMSLNDSLASEVNDD
jgi:hypothetical protein